MLSEPAMISTVLFATAVDLRASWTPFVWATAGAESYGYGGACAECLPAVTRNLASSTHIQGHQFIPYDAWQESYSRLAARVKLPMRERDFKRGFGIRSSMGYHASKLEAGVVGLAMKIITRSPR